MNKSLLLAALLALSVTACSKKEAPAPAPTPAPVAAPAAAPAPVVSAAPAAASAGGASSYVVNVDSKDFKVVCEFKFELQKIDSGS